MFLRFVRDAGGHLAERAELGAAREDLARGGELGVRALQLRELRRAVQAGRGQIDQGGREVQPRLLHALLAGEDEDERAEEASARDQRQRARAGSLLPGGRGHDRPELVANGVRFRAPADRRLGQAVLGDEDGAVSLDLEDGGTSGVNVVDGRAGEERDDLGGARCPRDEATEPDEEGGRVLDLHRLYRSRTMQGARHGRSYEDPSCRPEPTTFSSSRSTRNSCAGGAPSAS